MKKILILLFLMMLATKGEAATFTLYSNGNACLEENNATTNFSTTSDCGNETCTANQPYNLILNFPVSQIQGSVTAATLSVFEPGQGASNTIDIYRIIQPWVYSQATYNIYSTGNNWGTAGALGSGVDYTTTNSTTAPSSNGGFVNATVTGIVQDMITNGTNGILMTESDSKNCNNFYMQRNRTRIPTLTVTTNGGFSHTDSISQSNLSKANIN